MLRMKIEKKKKHYHRNWTSLLPTKYQGFGPVTVSDNSLTHNSSVLYNS